MDGGGYIKLWRKLLHNPIMQHDGLCRLWLYCLLKAQWNDRRLLMPGMFSEIEIKRGSFATSRSRLHADLYLAEGPKDLDPREMPTPSPITVWRRLLSLEAMDCVKLETVISRFTIVTVCNYETYQSQPDDYEQVVNRSCSGPEQLTLIDEELEEGKKGPVAPKFDPLETPKPPAIDTPAFSAAWSEWINYRRERRLSCRSATISRQLKFLAGLGEVMAIQSIDEAIRGGWQGVFAPKGTKAKPAAPTLFAGPAAFAAEDESHD